MQYLWGGFRMKRICILVFAILLFLVPKTEAAVEEVDGVWCVNGDLNLPVWDQGSGVSNFFDVSSAYVYADTDEYLVIKVNEGGDMRNGTIEMNRDNPQVLTQNKKTNELFYGGLKVTTKKFNDAFYLVKMHAISH